MASKAATDRFMAEMYRQDYYQFFLGFWSSVVPEKLIDSWYIRKLCQELQEVSERVFADERKKYDLIWNCPPGTSKSTIVSVLWQPWIWTRMPSARFISGSHSERLALDLSRKSRDCILSDEYQRLYPEIKLREDQNTKGYFTNTLGGMRYAVGVGGSVIGMHAHFLAVDDPIDPQGALSDLILADANSWMTETLSRRKVSVMLTPTVIIMQRLHQDDPTGNALDRRPDKIRHCCIPADTSWEIKPPEWKEFYEDGLLNPRRLPEEALDDAREELGEAGYAGQYGQCLVAGTIIQTKHGAVPIENVKEGQFVFDRHGIARKVLWSGISKYVEASDLSVVLFDNWSWLIGTHDHPVWSDTTGTFNSLQSLRKEDYNRVFAALIGSPEAATHPVAIGSIVNQRLRLSSFGFFDLEIANDLLDQLKIMTCQGTSSRGIPVYDLTVEDVPEFFANGILVHNSPIPRGGAMFKVDRLNYQHQAPAVWKRPPVRFWDKAATAKAGAYTVGAKMALDMQDRVWILDVIRGQWDSGTREQIILNTGRLDSKRVRQVVEKEAAGAGKESAENTVKRLTLAGLRASMEPACGDKEMRADPLSAHVNMGNVVLLVAPWNAALVAEMRFFPRSKYKDQIDACSGGFSQLCRKRTKIGALG